MDDQDRFVRYLLFGFFFTMEYKTCSRFRIVKQFLAHLVVARIHSHTYTSSHYQKTRERERDTERSVKLCGFFFFSYLSYSLVFFSFFFLPSHIHRNIQCLLSIRLLLVMKRESEEKKNDQCWKMRREVFCLCYF